jgi:hypothetical protein
MDNLPRIGRAVDLSDNSEFTELRREAALATLLELLELAAPAATMQAEGLAALLGAVLDSG